MNKKNKIIVLIISVITIWYYIEVQAENERLSEMEKIDDLQRDLDRRINNLYKTNIYKN